MTNYVLNLQLFADVEPTTITSNVVSPVNVTKQTSMSATMKTFYDTTLLENAREAMIFTQFGEKQPMHGNRVEWRKFNTFAKAMNPLTEGVIPTGQKFGMTNITGEITQHGDFTAVSDRLELESYDDVIFGATEEMGAAEGETYDTLTRNVLVAGNSVMYPIDDITSREGIARMHVLTPELVNKAATWLKKNKAPKINGSYVALIHPSVAYDLRQSEEWKEYHKYNDTAPIFKGEIGELHGVRFIETTNGKIWDNGSNTDGSVVYATLFLGAKAFGILDPEGEGMEMIVKTREQIGGPLNQFSTIGYKFCHGARILYQERLLRVETGSSFGLIDKPN